MTLEEARLMAGVNERAQRLFEDGYRAEWLDEHALEMTTPEGDTYLVDTLMGSCECRFFTEHGGKHECKHLLGYPALMQKQEAARDLLAHENRLHDRIRQSVSRDTRREKAA